MATKAAAREGRSVSLLQPQDASSVPSLSTLAAAASTTTILFRDDFSGTISTTWAILNQDAAYYTPTATYLELRANSGDLWGSGNNYKNLFVITNPTTSDFQITARLNQFSLNNENWEQFALVVYDDDDNYVRGDYGSLGAGGTPQVQIGQETSQVFDSDEENMDFGANPFYLRLRKVGAHYAFYYSTDGTNFLPGNFTFDYGDGTPARLGFVAMVDPSEDSIAQVDWFEVSTVPAQNNFSDEFDAAGLDPNWLVVNPNKDSSVRLSGNGYLQLIASPNNGGSDYWPQSNFNASRLLQRISGDWLLETRFVFTPTSDFQGAGLMICFDQAIYATTCGRIVERYRNAVDNYLHVAGNTTSYTATVTYVRLRKQGNTYTGWYSLDGVHWTPGGTGTFSSAPTYIGPFSIRQAWDGNYAVYSVANFDYIRLWSDPVIFEDFNDNTLNSSLWMSSVVGSGPVLTETNQRLEVFLPAASHETGDGVFSGGVESRCEVGGDFDMQVDYELLTWPPFNGVRVGFNGVERDSHANSEASPGEHYAANFGNALPIINTTHTSGTLRTTRNGDTRVAYYRDTNGQWVQILSEGGHSTNPLPLSLSVWSHDAYFANQDVRVAFDNFILLQGQWLCLWLTPDRSGTGLPGSVVTYTHILTNTGNVTDTFTVTHAGKLGWPVGYRFVGGGTVNPGSSITLLPGATTTLVVSVTVPSGVLSGTVETTVITATSQAGGNVTASITDRTTAGHTLGVALTPDRSGTGLPGSAVTYTHILTNTGNSTDTFALTHKGKLGWAVKYGIADAGTVNFGSSVTLGAGATATLVVSVTVPLGVFNGTVETTVITATSQAAGNVAAAVTDQTTVRAPIIYLPLIMR